MSAPYLCPMCRRNRSRFTLSYRVSLEVRKDEEDGHWVWQADEIELMNQGSKPDIQVKCMECEYQGWESVFAKAARRAASARQAGSNTPLRLPG